MRKASLLLLLFVFSCVVVPAQELVSHAWRGVLLDEAGAPVKGAEIHLAGPQGELVAPTAEDGSFRFAGFVADSYRLSVVIAGTTSRHAEPLQLAPASGITTVTVAKDGAVAISFGDAERTGSGAATGGEKLSSQTVSAIPLNKRDFSQLLLLAAGTMTDANGQTNFTQQFAINGQRGVEATFAMDGADVSDPEMGGATFSNFNVDAVEEIRSSSGWMPAEIGRGAAGFTNVITRSGAGGFHGSVFEFLRNSSLDARNYFDHPSIAEPGRIPPFRRNEFGFTNGGPIVFHKIYDGREKSFYFVQYQGFRQVLGTTQVLPVPTLAQRAGMDTTAYARRYAADYT